MTVALATPRRSPAVRGRAALCACALASMALAPAGVSAQDNLAGGITTVEVFANSAMLITPTHSDRYRLVIHRMDRLEQVKQTINQQIPSGGEGPARKWLAANEDKIKHQVRPAAIAAANAINLANFYKIDRLPAMVINRQAVVYGITDVEAALERFQETRGRPR